MTDTSNKASRLKAFLNYKKLKQNAVAQKIGVSAGFLSRVLNDEEDVTAKVIFGMSENYAELNINWLITGEGEMTIQHDVVNEPSELITSRPLTGLERLLDEYRQEIDLLKSEVNELRKMVERIREEVQGKDQLPKKQD